MPKKKTNTKKPLSNAERQARYRKNNAIGKGKNARLNTWLDVQAYFALERLAKHNGVTKKEMLEKILMQEDKKIRDTLEKTKINEYLDSEK